MYVLIVPHDTHHRMQVDQRNMVLDLSTVQGSLVDPTIHRVEWDHLMDGKVRRPGGIIIRDGQRTKFFDASALAPYLAAFNAEWLRRHQDQAVYDVKMERLAHDLARPIIVAKPGKAEPIAYEGA